MGLSKQTVQYVANLARIELKDQELDKISLQLESILSFIDKLNSLDAGNIEPTQHILRTDSILRDDEPKPSLPLDKTLLNAPAKEGSFFAVPKVIE